MSNKRETPETGLGRLVLGVSGIACPVPVLGEGLLAGFLYPTVEKVPQLEDRTAASIAVSTAVAGLTRISFYEPVYLPIINAVTQYF